MAKHRGLRQEPPWEGSWDHLVVPCWRDLKQGPQPCSASCLVSTCKRLSYNTRAVKPLPAVDGTPGGVGHSQVNASLILYLGKGAAACRYPAPWLHRKRDITESRRASVGIHPSYQLTLTGAGQQRNWTTQASMEEPGSDPMRQPPQQCPLMPPAVANTLPSFALSGKWLSLFFDFAKSYIASLMMYLTRDVGTAGDCISLLTRP